MAVSALLPCLGLLAIWRMSGVAPHAQDVRPSFLSLMGQIWRHGLIICLQGIGFAAIGAFFALFFLDRNWSSAGLGLTAFGGGFVLVRVLFGHLPDRFGGLPVAVSSLAVETIGQVLIWSAPDPGLALAGAFLTGLGCSLIYPAMGREVVHLVAPHLRGTALGEFSAFQDLAYGLTGPIAGLLADRAGMQQRLPDRRRRGGDRVLDRALSHSPKRQAKSRLWAADAAPLNAACGRACSRDR